MMLRALSRRVLLSNQSNIVPKNGVAYAAEQVKKRPMEMNSVKLMGTIEHEIHKFRSGPMNLYLKTLNEDTSYCVHKVAIANRNLLNIVGDQLRVGQRIYVGGRLKTENMYVEKQRCQKVEILANELYLLESNPTNNLESDQIDTRPIQLDENSVEIVAFVGTEVHNNKNLCAFSILTHFTKHKGTIQESEGQEYHKVMIYKDPHLIEIGRRLQKYDRIYVNGQISYITKEYPDGVSYSNGFIQPKNLVVFKKFS